MKSSFILIIFLFIFSLQQSDFAQGEAAVPFLLLQPSPSLSALGQTGTTLPTEDPFGFVWNPAQLGYSSQKNNLSFIFYPSKVDWLNLSISGYELKGLAFNAGYDFKELIGIPLSIGFGYSKTEFDFGTFYRMDELGNILGTETPKDYDNLYSLGVGIDYIIQLSAGFTIKHINSTVVDFTTLDSIQSVTKEKTVNDFGILLNVPVLRLIDDKYKFKLDNDDVLKPDFNFSLGYSKSNIGDSIYYVDPAQADPLPRIDRLGYGISAGLDFITDDFNVKAINLAFTAEADDILINSDSTGWSYQSTLSDLRFWRNIIDVEGDGRIVSHAGFKIDLFETFSYSTGHFTGRDFGMRKTNGYELRAKGLFKLYALWAKNPITDFLGDHFDIIFYNTNFFAGHEFETKLTGLAFYIYNLNGFF